MIFSLTIVKQIYIYKALTKWIWCDKRHAVVRVQSVTHNHRGTIVSYLGRHGTVHVLGHQHYASSRERRATPKERPSQHGW